MLIGQATKDDDGDDGNYSYCYFIIHKQEDKMSHLNEHNFYYEENKTMLRLEFELCL